MVAILVTIVARRHAFVFYAKYWEAAATEEANRKDDPKKGCDQSLSWLFLLNPILNGWALCGDDFFSRTLDKAIVAKPLRRGKAEHEVVYESDFDPEKKAYWDVEYTVFAEWLLRHQQLDDWYEKLHRNKS